MGLFDSVVSAFGQSPQGGGQGNELLNVVVSLLAKSGQGGGLAGLVQQFEQGGLGHVIGSWIGTGQNLPISADQLGSVLGSEQVQQIAQQLGLSSDEVLGQLSHLLPQVVDKMTPDGQLPADGGAGALPGLSGLGDVGGLLDGLLKR